MATQPCVCQMRLRACPLVARCSLSDPHGVESRTLDLLVAWLCTLLSLPAHTVHAIGAHVGRACHWLCMAAFPHLRPCLCMSTHCCSSTLLSLYIYISLCCNGYDGRKLYGARSHTHTHTHVHIRTCTHAHAHIDSHQDLSSHSPAPACTNTHDPHTDTQLHRCTRLQPTSCSASHQRPFDLRLAQPRAQRPPRAPPSAPLWLPGDPRGQWREGLRSLPASVEPWRSATLARTLSCQPSRGIVAS
jgi:hypothetical protein